MTEKELNKIEQAGLEILDILTKKYDLTCAAMISTLESVKITILIEYIKQQIKKEEK